MNNKCLILIFCCLKFLNKPNVSQSLIWSLLSRVEPIVNHPLPMTLRQLREFLGISGYCCIWNVGYAELAWSLCKLITENQQAQTNKLVWSPQTQKAFEGSPTCSSAGSNFELAHRIFLTEKKAKATCLKGNCYYCFANGLNLISLLMGKILLYRLLNT